MQGDVNALPGGSANLMETLQCGMEKGKKTGYFQEDICSAKKEVTQRHSIAALLVKPSKSSACFIDN